MDCTKVFVLIRVRSHARAQRMRRADLKVALQLEPNGLVMLGDGL
jgi:hypothetical protein